MIDAAGARKRRNPDRFGAGLQQGARCRARGCAGGEDVVDEKDVLSRDSGRIRYGKRAAHVEPALVSCQSRLACGGTQTDQGAGSEGQSPAGSLPAQDGDGFGSDQPCLVEAALGVLGAMQRNRDDQHLCRRFRLQLHKDAGEYSAKFVSRRAEAVVFQRVDQIAHPAFVGPVRNGLHKGRRNETADTAQTLHAGIGCRRPVHGVAASGAE